jgi:acetyl-CoA synthetase
MPFVAPGESVLVSVEPSLQPEIEALYAESRSSSFPPSPEFAARANAHADLYDEAERDFEAFWARLARERIDWTTPFETTLEWDLPFAKWFTGGTLNVAYNCVDRHVERGLGDKVAYHWIGEPGDTRTITYADLYARSRRRPTPSSSSASAPAPGSPSTCA